MANANAPFGLRPVRYLSGAPYNGAANRYSIPSTDSTAVYIGGMVKPAGSADANGVMTVTGNVSTGNAVIGVVVGVEPVTASSTIYREASVGGALAVTAVGNAADGISFTSGSTTTGLSSMQLDTSTATASGDGTEDFLIIGFMQRPNNEVASANAKVLVRLNNHFFIDGQAGA